MILVLAQWGGYGDEALVKRFILSKDWDSRELAVILRCTLGRENNSFFQRIWAMPELDKFRKEDSRVISLLSNCTFPDVLRIILNSVEPSRRQGMLSALWSTFANRESLAIIDMVPLIDVYHEAGVDFHGDTTVINRAVDTGDTEAVERLIEYGAELNATTEETGGDFNPLMYAVHNGDEIITKLLLENGANPNLQNKKKETAILYALGSPIGSKECVRLLLEHGADVHVTAPETGESCLELAERWGDREVIAMIKEAGG